jgi:NYN domain
MTGTYKNKRQKGVDILLAVDVLRHAERRNMDKVLLMSGDGDFRPLVQALVDTGLTVWVFGDRHHTSQDLKLAADRYVPLSLTDYFGLATEDFRRQHRLPEMMHGPNTMTANGYTPRAQGMVGGMPAELCFNGAIAGIKIPEANSFNVYGLPEERIRLFCELSYGSVVF